MNMQITDPQKTKRQKTEQRKTEQYKTERQITRLQATGFLIAKLQRIKLQSIKPQHVKLNMTKLKATRLHILIMAIGLVGSMFSYAAPMTIYKAKEREPQRDARFDHYQNNHNHYPYDKRPSYPYPYPQRPQISVVTPNVGIYVTPQQQYNYQKTEEVSLPYGGTYRKTTDYVSQYPSIRPYSEAAQYSNAPQYSNTPRYAIPVPSDTHGKVIQQGHYYQD